MTEVNTIRIAFSDGRHFALDALVVASDRGRYYANQEGGAPGSDKWQHVYEEERDFALENAEELTDWLKNNMDWSDIKDSVVEVVAPAAPPSMQELFSTAEIDVTR